METVDVILIPEEPNMLAAVGYWLLHRLGCLSKDVLVIRRNRVSRQMENMLISTKSYSLLSTDTAEKLFALSLDLPAEEITFTRELINYAKYCSKLDRAERRLINKGYDTKLFRWFIDHFYHFSQSFPESFISSMEGKLAESSLESLASKIPHTRRLRLPNLPPACDPPLHPVYINIPTWDKPGRDAQMVGTEWEPLAQERVRLVEGRRILIAVCGPPNSGKSTTCAILASKTEKMLEELKSFSDFSDLQVTCAGVDLDLATPTIDLINSNQGSNKEKHTANKKPWNIEDVYPAFKALNKRKENIIFLDMPGKIDVITHLLLSVTDAGLIISSDWDQNNSWRKVLKGFGIYRVAEARSHLLPTEERPESLVRVFKREIITGRIVGANRELRTWDPFLDVLAKSLLYKYVPNHIENQHVKHQKIVNSIWR